ncbi:Putative SH3 domain, SLA1 domain 1, SHD1, sterile alpha motif/pointed domain superfamily [Septoria linicola]|uniref:Actin cytoskeleton-regulatory complex protein SLA1 n=1 Tax=Septoria linicola TaxID=215465 RepID=A0A9Q9AJ27_9PEZI|nr:putative SH3 domain, SLA1 domain 1, SHD1, sterile alpha motif/pointed domain superfamily [Septoria linicola]USW47858.1 Putative SH3 domain, SLA1 domain 1, SHD1, sterile alpha motif/pointed domain superfamily [Septoria linicola]
MPFVDVVRAIYDYAPQSDEELDVREGDLLFVLDKSTDDDWWKCKKKAASDDDEEPEGLVPNNYVEAVTPISQAKALYDYSQQTDEELSFKEDSRLDIYDETDPDWTLVGHNGKYGFAPAIYIERLTPAATSSAPPARVLAPTPPPMPARPASDDQPLPGEADYVPPSPEPARGNPAAALAGIIAQRTGTTAPSPTADRSMASPPLPQRSQYTPEQSDEEAAPSLPRRPPSQTVAPASPPPLQTQYASRLSPKPAGVLSSPPYSRTTAAPDHDYGEEVASPRGFHLYNVHEMVSHMGKNKKMPTTLGINIAKGIIMISPEKSRDGPSKEWTAEKLTHYSIEGKHVFVELVRPSKSIDFHAGAKDTAQEIVSALGELAGAVRQEGLREVLAASAGTGFAGLKKGQMLYEFMAQGEDEVTVAAGDEVIVLDDVKSEEWWMIRRMKNGKEGVVPSSYVEITGTVPQGPETITGLNEARSTVEQNRLEEERLTKQAARKDKKRQSEIIPPERHSSLAGDTRRTSMRGSDKRGSKDQPKSKPNTSRVRTWTDRSGSFRVEAEFIGLREGKIHLHKLNGVKIAVPVAKMAVEDLEYVERATGASLDEDKPLSDIKRRNTQKQKERERQNGTRSAAGASIQKKEDYDWFDFFLQCGVDPHICERYAGSFSRDNMGPEILPDVNQQLLRTLGLKEGDILRVMKFLDTKYNRHTDAASPAGPDEASAGGLFAGPGGVLKNNTRKGRPAPAVQTTDVVDENAFRSKIESPGAKTPLADTHANASTSGAGRQSANGFDDDAWNVKPPRTQTSTAATAPATKLATPSPEPPKPLINDDIASLSISAPPLQPTPAVQSPPATESQQATQATAPVADQAIFDKIAALAPAARQQAQATGFLQPQQTAMPRQRPAAPPQQAGPGSMLPPPRAASAPGFPPQQQSSFGPAPLQAQLTGYQHSGNMQQMPSIGMQPQQQFMQSQQTSFPQQSFGQGYQQPNTIQSLQQNYPAMQPQPTGFQPQGQFAPQQTQQYGFGQPSYNQQLVNGSQTGSPFADPPRQPFQPIPSGLSSSFTAQQTGFQPSFNIAQATGMNGYGAQPTQATPQMPPQQTGGVFGPSQPLSIPAAPLVPQKTGPPPPVRFGVQPGAKPLMPQPTGRANLSKATPQNPFGF